MRSSAAGAPSRCASRDEVEVEVLGEPLEIALVEELDLDLGVALAQLPQLPVLARHERLLHHGELDVEVLLRQVEFGANASVTRPASSVSSTNVRGSYIHGTP